LKTEARLAAAQSPQLKTPLDDLGWHVLAEVGTPFEWHHHLVDGHRPPRFPLTRPDLVEAVDEGTQLEKLVVSLLAGRDVVGVVVEVESPEEYSETVPVCACVREIKKERKNSNDVKKLKQDKTDTHAHLFMNRPKSGNFKQPRVPFLQ
jgi:hypothetical protein